jgi:hypothetical protein
MQYWIWAYFSLMKSRNPVKSLLKDERICKIKGISLLFVPFLSLRICFYLSFLLLFFFIKRMCLRERRRLMVNAFGHNHMIAINLRLLLFHILLLNKEKLSKNK